MDTLTKDLEEFEANQIGGSVSLAKFAKLIEDKQEKLFHVCMYCKKKCAREDTKLRCEFLCKEKLEKLIQKSKTPKEFINCKFCNRELEVCVEQNINNQRHIMACESKFKIAEEKRIEKLRKKIAEINAMIQDIPEEYRNEIILSSKNN